MVILFTEGVAVRAHLRDSASDSCGYSLRAGARAVPVAARAARYERPVAGFLAPQAHPASLSLRRMGRSVRNRRVYSSILRVDEIDTPFGCPGPR